MAISPEDFVKRLQSISNDGGSAYGALRSLAKEEGNHAEAALGLKGYLALSQAFQSFFLETVYLVNWESRQKVKATLSEFYPLFLARLVHSVHTLRAAQISATQGYPLQGYTLLRNTFDTLILQSAAVQKFTDFYSIEGVTPGSELNHRDARKLRKRTEFDVRNRFQGSRTTMEFVVRF